MAASKQPDKKLPAIVNKSCLMYVVYAERSFSGTLSPRKGRIVMSSGILHHQYQLCHRCTAQ